MRRAGTARIAAHGIGDETIGKAGSVHARSMADPALQLKRGAVREGRPGRELTDATPRRASPHYRHLVWAARTASPSETKKAADDRTRSSTAFSPAHRSASLHKAQRPPRRIKLSGMHQITGFAMTCSYWLATLQTIDAVGRFFGRRLNYSPEYIQNGSFKTLTIYGAPPIHVSEAGAAPMRSVL
ncbi:MAG: hypothetical protein ABIO86_11775 [Sphingomonas sp.]